MQGPKTRATGKLTTLNTPGQVFEGEVGMADSIGICPVNPIPAYKIQGQIRNQAADFVLDTGAAVTLVRKELWELSKLQGMELEEWNGKQLVGVEGTPLHVCGIAQVQISLGGRCFQSQVVIVSGLTADAILGLDFLEANGCTINLGKKTLHFQDCNLSLSLDTSIQSSPTTVRVAVVSTLQVPAYSEMEVMAKVEKPSVPGLWAVEGETDQIMVAHAVVDASAHLIPVRLLNPSNKVVTLYNGKEIASLQPADEICGLGVAAVQPRADSEISKDKEEMLWEMVEAAGESLNGLEKEQLYCLLAKYADIFAACSSDLGRTDKVKHQIDTGSSAPIRQQVRRVPPARREEVKKLLKDMLAQDVIQPTNSPWASPVVLVRKKDGSTRFCVDYRKVNSITRKDAYPLPRIDDTLDTLSGSQLFSTLDLLSGYWQVEVDPKDREKTAFCTPDGLFEFRVMPFGLCNAPATFQRLMDTILAGLQWTNCLVYLDDIIILGKTFQEHLCNLRAVFDQIRSANLKLKPRKCILCRQSVQFLGHIVSREGVATDPSKTEKVANWPVPQNKREVQQFLGLASYYRRFVRDYATIAKPLHRLTEKNAPFKWTSASQEAFENLCQRLVSSPILAFPDCSKPFLLDTDASDSGIGAVLSQIQDDGTECVVAYASRVLSKPERRYCVTRRELLAVVVFIQHFRPYLLGNHFTLRTDHGSLRWLQNFKEPEGQLARWLEKLQEYTFTIEHRQGKKHGNADALSRLPCNQCGRDTHCPDLEEIPESTAICAVINTNQLGGWSPEEIRSQQLQDEVVGPALQAREKKCRPTRQFMKTQKPESRRLLQQYNQLIVKNGQLWRVFEDSRGTVLRHQLVVPTSLKTAVLRELHEGTASGHLGEEKTMSRLRERFYWSGQWNDVRDWCRTCAGCVTRKTAAPKQKAPLQTIPTSFPMQVVAMDILGPLPESESGNSYILVVGDYFTRWMEAYPIPNQEAKTVARIVTDEFFFRFSIPEQLHTDQGRQFESELILEICKSLNVRKSHTTPYHPQCDGLVERFNRTLLNMLSTSIKDHHFTWQEHIRPVCMAYNTSVQSTTGYTPFYLMFGREAKIPADIMFGTNTVSEQSPNEYAANLRSRLCASYDHVRKNLGTGHKRQKEFYDQRVHGEPYKEGDLVWLRSPVVPRGKSKKFHHPWTGPFKVIKCLSEVTYRIQSVSGRRRRIIVHFDRLKRCHPGTRLEVPEPPSSDAPPHQGALSLPFGTTLDVRDVADNPSPPDPAPAPQRRYPTRDRAAPDWLGSMVRH